MMFSSCFAELIFSRTLLAASLGLAILCVSPSFAQEKAAVDDKPKETAPAKPKKPPTEPKKAPTKRKVEGVEHFRMQSPLLSKFWGRPMYVEAGIVLPPEADAAKETLPVCYSIHGFGGSHRTAWRAAKPLREGMKSGKRPRMLYVFLNAQFSLGHHEFADSVNNGPWGQALIEEFIPALEAKYQTVGKPNARFLTGHSSGGWSSLWLQVTYPKYFGGVWSTAPDSIDFRDFTGIDVYQFENAYQDPEGKPIQLVRNGKGEWVRTLKEYAQGEYKKRTFGGQFASFDAVFSPRDADGQPMKLFDRETGAINKKVLDSWKRYDICLQLRERWSELKGPLKGKLRIFVGERDTYRLEGAVKLAQKELEQLGSDAQIVIVPERTHGSVLAPHELWPDGLLTRIHREMHKTWQASMEEPATGAADESPAKP